MSTATPSHTTQLPQPRYDGGVSVEHALQMRRSVRSYKNDPLYERVTGKYGQRGLRYVHMEVGHAAQNACLQATALGLNAVVIGAFRDAEVKMIAELPAEEQPQYFVPVGS